MTVAVIIVNYNSAALLERCLQSLSDQSVAPDQVIIVDNASDEALSLQLLDSITNAEIIRNRTNTGYGAAINRAVREAVQTNLFCCLNPDAFPEPDWLEQMLNAAAAHPDHGAWAPLMLSAEDPSIIDGAGDVMHFTGTPYRRFHGRRVDRCELKMEPVFSACAGAAMYQVAAFREVGGFDESFFMYVEDVDLGFRLNGAGYRCLFVPSAVVRHVGSATTGYRSEFSIYHGHRNLIWCYFKNMPLPLLVLTLPFHILANLAAIGLYFLRGQTHAICKAKLHGLQGIGRMMRARRKMNDRPIWLSLTWFR